MVHTSMSQIGFQPKFPNFEKCKALQGYDRADLRPTALPTIDNNSCAYVIQEVSDSVSAVV